MSYGYPGPEGQQPPQGQPQWGQQQPPAPPGWQQPPTGPGWGGPPPPRNSSAGKIIGFSCLGVVAVFVVLIVIVLAVGGGDSGSPKGGSTPTSDKSSTGRSSAPAKETVAGVPDGPEGDVRITSCKVDATTSWPSAELLITNRSSKTSNYAVSVEFVDASGKRLGDAFTATNNLAPGQKAQETAQGLDTIKAKIKCRVTEVTRYAS
ncbi:FxLYD domain-containing protein [Streptomyces sp. WI04-05B]|uniref:FxLYD domain-containing protein n=1 Tax=Streptomyces TaxID=1883 RepID=UPI0029BBA85E|nr:MULTISPECIES: FxLYD domain-containing protein [unclassified Streptomyces]MDX2542427.1 FxLYD domain-containing protein [Streptomyces sp. WI04-05B]MDX2582554.1 FxLYD domain-containing protein [Streptomyces sp. WI04-05A]